MPGKVFLVGAGPGDPGLITVKGLNCLRQAEVVVYDRLLDPGLLAAAPANAERVFVGKERGGQALTQAQINELLAERAAAGQIVVRLKGGDPLVLGRGGEEAQYLAQRDIPFALVPGVTAATAAAAYAGIPVTQRGLASAFTVVSGSEAPDKDESAIPWDTLARTGGTLVILMGWAALPSILARLQQSGLPAATPVALVQWGTWPQQRTVTGTLSDVYDLAQAAGLTAPVAAIIGPVVRLREELAWFDRRPLFGKRVLITRSRVQASLLRELLAEQGAETLELPTIEIAPLPDYTDLDAALGRYGLLPFDNPFGKISNYWLIFASVNAVAAVFERLELAGQDARALAGATVAAIGPATAAALADRGIRADFVPQTAVSELAVSELAGREWEGLPVLLPGADIGRDALAQGLAAQGARVERIAAYRTIVPPGAAEQARRICGGGIEVITFTSSSTVRNLLELLGGDKALLEPALIACIGPVTAAAARELGLRVDLVAAEATVEGLAAAVARHFTPGEQGV